MVRIKVDRRYKKEGYTIGLLYVDGRLWCNTLEDTVRPDGVKIQGQTAIPAGVYNVCLTMSPKFKRSLPLLDNVPNFTGVRIHAGNTAKDTEGCILVGENTKRGMVLNSRYWEKKIVDYIADNGGWAEIRIKD